MDMQDLLGRMMQGNMTPSAAQRVDSAIAPKPGEDASGVQGMFNAWSESMKSGVGGQGMLDRLGNVAGDMFGQAKSGVTSGNPLAIGGLAALAGAVLTGGGSALKGAVGAGGLAVLAKVAYDALQASGNKAKAPEATASGEAAPATGGDLPLGLRPPAGAQEEAKLEHRAGLAVRAMITAAKADGRVDEAERTAIMGKVKAAGGQSEALRYIEARMAEPLDLDGLVADIDGHEEALQVYAASLLAIEADTDAEIAYLDRLAGRIGLTAEERSAVHGSLGIKPTQMSI